MLAVGFIMPMVIAPIVVQTFLRFVTRQDFTSSTLFRIGLGLVALT